LAILFFFKDFICLFERERELKRGRGAKQRDRGKEREKQSRFPIEQEARHGA